MRAVERLRVRLFNKNRSVVNHMQLFLQLLFVCVLYIFSIPYRALKETTRFRCTLNAVQLDENNRDLAVPALLQMAAQHYYFACFELA